jgi:hypothetical protein
MWDGDVDPIAATTALMACGDALWAPAPPGTEATAARRAVPNGRVNLRPTSGPDTEDRYAHR